MSLNREVFAFGPFVLDPVERRLQRDGAPVPLAGKAFNVLVSLVERHGELVTRDELLTHVWGGVNVEDAVITVNISTIRKILGDDRNGHSFVETVPRVGYRFIAPVKRVEYQSRSAAAALLSRRSAAIGIAITVIVASLWMIGARQRDVAPRPVVQRQLTANPVADPVARAAISPDGRYLAYSDLEGLHVRLIASGQTHLIPPPPGYCFR